MDTPLVHAENLHAKKDGWPVECLECQNAWNAGMLECRNAGMPECRNAGMPALIGEWPCALESGT